MAMKFNWTQKVKYMEKMNKTYFINTLCERLPYSKDKCIIINSIVEDTFIIGKKNKDIMIGRFINELNVSEDEANHIYEVVMNVISSSIKKRLNPFRKDA